MLGKKYETNLEENKSEYLKKMNRQLKEVKKSVDDLEKIAKKRRADENVSVKNELETLREKWQLVNMKLENLEAEVGKVWPSGSQDVSGAYKELEDAVQTVGSKIKRN